MIHSTRLGRGCGGQSLNDNAEEAETGSTLGLTDQPALPNQLNYALCGRLTHSS